MFFLFSVNRKSTICCDLDADTVYTMDCNSDLVVCFLNTSEDERRGIVRSTPFLFSLVHLVDDAIRFAIPGCRPLCQLCQGAPGPFIDLEITTERDLPFPDHRSSGVGVAVMLVFVGCLPRLLMSWTMILPTGASFPRSSVTLTWMFPR